MLLSNFAIIALVAIARAGTPISCANAQLSCRNTTVVQDLCCFNAPGGQLVQTQFWDTNPSTGPSNSWTIHGLWPDKCDGTYESKCDPSRGYTNIATLLTSFGKSDVLNYMNTFWKNAPSSGSDAELWQHEWETHGTCINTLDPSCYTGYQTGEEAADFFQKTVDIFKTLQTYVWLADAGITPSTTATYTSSAIEAALSAGHGHPVVIRCANGALNEAWYSFDVMGSVQTGNFVAADPVGQSSNCPQTGVKYLPKSGSPVSVSTPSSSSTRSRTLTSTTGPVTNPSTPSSSVSSTASAPSPTGSSTALSGRGYLYIVVNGSQEGCLISGGTWYASGSCATYTATPSGSGFTLATSKGLCAISGSKFTCSSTTTTATVFSALGGQIALAGSTTFFASTIAEGQNQEAIYAASNAVALSIVWQAL